MSYFPLTNNEMNEEIGTVRNRSANTEILVNTCASQILINKSCTLNSI